MCSSNNIHCDSLSFLDFYNLKPPSFLQYKCVPAKSQFTSSFTSTWLTQYQNLGVQFYSITSMLTSANSTTSPAAVGLTSKRQKFQNKSSSDRISNLPEPLLCLILSLLPTKKAVTTSILSKRWRFLWTCITNLDFSDDRVFSTNRRKTSAKEKMQKLTNFINYVNRILLLLNPPSIQKFSLRFHQFSDVFHISTWICAAVGRNVRDLELNLSTFYEQPIELPRSLFDCKKFEVLKLTEGIVFNIPKGGSVSFPKLRVLHLDSVDCGEIPAGDGSICFPVLKILHLVGIKYTENDDSIAKLMCKCPVLEDLLIRRNYQDNLSNIDMCAPALRNAEIELGYNSIACKVQIDAPVLQYLKIVNWNPSQEFLIKEAHSLIEAKLINTYNHLDGPGQQGYHAFKLIKAVDKVKCLSVSGVTVKAIKAGIGILPLFCNLTRLDMAVYCCELSVLQRFIQNSIKLQHLVIKKEGYKSCRVEEKWWTEFAHGPKCLHYTLKRVEIQNVVGCSDEVALIKNMLNNGKILEKITIRTSLYGDEKYQLLQKISMFPRESAACEFEFS